MASPPYVSRERNQHLKTGVLPAIYQRQEYVKSGGLVSYSTRVTNWCSKAGVDAARILKRREARRMAGDRPTKFEPFINLKTSKALGLSVQPFCAAQIDSRSEARFGANRRRSVSSKGYDPTRPEAK